MESRNLFLFIFIFLINTKILESSEDYEYGYISLNSTIKLSPKPNFATNVTTYCDDFGCNISFKGDFKDFTSFFNNPF